LNCLLEFVDSEMKLFWWSSEL